MTFQFSAPWHKISFDRFLNERLPELLAARLPLAGYTAQPEGERTCRVAVEFNPNNHPIRVEYPGLPQPDPEGQFWLEGEPLMGGPRGIVPFVVVPTASNEELDHAAMQCVGEQLYDYIAARLGQAPAGISWDEATARALLPLDALFNDFLNENAQLLDVTNWHARHTHLRRILIPSRTRVIAPGQMGRVDPFETPEGPNIGRVFTIALGAEIRYTNGQPDGRLIIIDDRPVAGLGPNAAQIPFLEHDDANRLLMGSNMMRQGLVPPEAEAALVQTGNAPANAGPDFWCGRNLLTAFVAWGEASTEDGLILSETCARQVLNYPYPAEPGDKLANRHGTKGVVGQILPDDQMPHLADGTPVDIVFSFTGIHTRMNFGQVREAVMGRIARAEGKPAIIPSFQSPAEDEIRARLIANNLPETGMERLRAGKDGPELSYPATVGWVYWYRLAHLARPKLRVLGDPRAARPAPESESDVHPHPVFPLWENGQELGEMELSILRQAGALRNAREAVTTRATAWQMEDLTGHSQPASSPYFRALAARLAAAAIEAALETPPEGPRLALRFAQTQPPDALRLVRPMPHPWLGEQRIAWVGAPPVEAGSAAQQAFAALQKANERAARWLAAQQPERAAEDETPDAMLRKSAYLNSLFDQLENRLTAYFDTLLPPSALRFNAAQAYSARAVIAPGIGLRLDQVGLPEEIISGLFAGQPQDEASLSRSWVIIYRAPAVTPTALIAFHPLRVAGPSIRLHPQACALLNADFDGDQVAVFRPLSADAQREAGEKLSVAAHIARSPELIPALLPPHEGIWGLAYLSLNADGRRQITSSLGLADLPIPAPVPQTDLAAALREIYRLEGAERLLRVANALAHLGYAAADASGASISPFAVSQVPLPPPPEGNDPAAWEIYVDACAEAILSGRDYANPNLGPQLLSAAVRQRSRRNLPLLVGPRGVVINAAGQPVIVRHSLAEGRTAEELYATVALAREGLAKLAFEGEEILQESNPVNNPGSAAFGGAVTLLARARRSRRPGLVFARAAASAEFDPLTDVESRILMGL